MVNFLVFKSMQDVTECAVEELVNTWCYNDGGAWLQSNAEWQQLWNGLGRLAAAKDVKIHAGGRAEKHRKMRKNGKIRPNMDFLALARKFG